MVIQYRCKKDMEMIKIITMNIYHRISQVQGAILYLVQVK